MPKDAENVPQAPSREQLARLPQALDRIGPSRQQLESLKSHLALAPEVGEAARRMASQVADLRRPEARATRAQLAEALDRLAALDREIAIQEERLAALRREAAGRRETVRRLQAGIARATGSIPAPPAAADPAVAASAPAPIAPGKEEQDGPQAELTRLFFHEVYAGPPPKKLGYRALHERMKAWAAEKNQRDGGNRIAASESTIRRVREAL